MSRRVYEDTLHFPRDRDHRTPQLCERFEKACTAQTERERVRAWKAANAPAQAPTPSNVITFKGAQP